MVRILITGLFLLLLRQMSAQQLDSVNLDELQDLLEQKDDTIYVLNFWATWCSPCVTEIGYFESLHRKMSDQEVKVILINLDFPNQLEERVIPFLNEKDITAKVFNMTELDYNLWIPLVDEHWTGTIPATLIFKDKKRIFFSEELNRQQLFTAVESLM